ncbi:MAG: hypothetical protein Q8N88_05015 [Nanoarchaeota archaeon]|nr:hypothetical protein [Nanoarchaeota archaeon]
MKIILISCCSKKLNYPAKAKNLYCSALFKKSFTYAQKLNPDKIFILSAKYGLIDSKKEISPYNITLNKMTEDETRRWSNDVLKKLRKNFNLDDDKFIFLAGENYRKYLVTKIKNYEIPMLGLGIGKQLQWLTKRI